MFAAAQEGTLFLDEVGELPKELQVKLLRVLQEGEVRPLGGDHAQHVDVRIVAATVKDLEAETRAGGFREDLFYRLNVVALRIPPLRDRQEDIPVLVEHFIHQHREALGVKIEGITNRALGRLMSYSWPGNVRELENAVERAMVLCDRRRIDMEDLPLRDSDATRRERLSDKHDLLLKPQLKAFEGELIQEALKRTRGNRTRAAALLGITHRALMYKIQSQSAKEVKDHA
jgi:two-component system response regulator AtoC